jgi:predicted TIM-barrel fold metal-dependent hydrolase
LLSHVVDEIGWDRVIFSIDYPYDEVSDAVNWWNSVPPEAVGGKDAYEAIGRTNAIKLLKLNP